MSSACLVSSSAMRILPFTSAPLSRVVDARLRRTRVGPGGEPGPSVREKNLAIGTLPTASERVPPADWAEDRWHPASLWRVGFTTAGAMLRDRLSRRDEGVIWLCPN